MVTTIYAPASTVRRFHRRIAVSPQFARLSPPVIVIGMHRSGTSLVSGLLSCMGAYMDPDWPRAGEGEAIVPPGPLLRRNGYGEATAFRLLNERLLAAAGTDWHNPEPFLAVRERAVFERRSLLAIQSATFASLNRDYLRRAERQSLAVWGWKDPRNSITLPYWLRAFPDSRIIHVRRNPDRIAESLLRRAQAAPAPAPGFSARIKRAATDPGYLARAIRRRLVPDVSVSPEPEPPLDRRRCLDLAEQYVDECVRYRALSDRYLEVHYEDILREPDVMAERLAEFACIVPSTNCITRAAALVAKNGA